ncbi:uncharacterized protein [Halyomorpha halys]|uniref:uncharacterized protein isoform X2 n=1 Tax=Halyomorpha halys TaxID=286706 RepID=UPI0006D523F1|nr:uncharacterized protein LOC106685176 isoform X2 [Halyomorpha halys]
MMQKPCFKLYKKFNRKKGLPLSCYKKILKDGGMNIHMDDLKFSMERALKHGFAEKMARRYRMPWRLCDYHIARTLGVKGLKPPRFGSVAWKDIRQSETDGTYPEYEEAVKDLVPQETVIDCKDENETADKSVNVKFEDKTQEERRSAHYLITEYWNNMEGFFGTLETGKQRANGDFTRPVVPLPQKEPMWTFVSPEPSVILCKQESNTNNFLSGPPSSQNVTQT